MTVLLVRHPSVVRAWTGRCYGRSDMGWSREGAAMARDLVQRLSAEPVTHVVHSDMIRTRRLADRIAHRLGCSSQADARWRERDFGAWEGRSWHAIWRETGDEMDRMMTDVAGFRPGGGETGADLIARVRAAWSAIPTRGAILVIAHGGSIAALRCWLAGAPPERMADFIPACGEVVRL